ncbi:TIGR02679 family protein [Paenibacillus uliginis N3/975]|uniref:TIGR02679 family protein n=1 Tax=Paenibacillus uliginis N3/975 TaxID=1313296 RepID=A0A1X7HNY3_9BACL|nr:TIGR02679 domain-containing protein [Paenibacillus uliginis]SMF90184.1 TIGR02679 family protein [Paenibacillus uliginis N3/975]
MVHYRKTAKQYYSDPSFSNLLDAVFRKYRGQNGVKGNAKITVGTTEEASRLQDFFGTRLTRRVRPGTEVEVHLSVIAEELERGYKLTIPELYEILNDEPLLTNMEQKEIREMKWLQLFDQVNSKFENLFKTNLYNSVFSEEIYNWFNRLKGGDASGYGVVKNLFREGGGGDELFQCVKALWFLCIEREVMFQKKGISVAWIRLPILAEFVTLDPHAFDWKQPGGRLLWYALRDINNQRIKNGINVYNQHLMLPNFMEKRQVYRNSGIMDDDISSNMLIFAKDFMYSSSPRTLNLREIEECEDWPEYSALYVFENPSVFSFLMDETIHFLNGTGLSYEQLPENFPALVCTSGQLRDASKHFIENCLKTNPRCVIYYSGDFDRYGVEIASGVNKMFIGAVEMWKMDSDTYIRYLNRDSLLLSNHDRKVLESKPDNELASTMADKRRKVYQESITFELKNDWIELLRLSVKV